MAGKQRFFTSLRSVTIPGRRGSGLHLFVRNSSSAKATYINSYVQPSSGQEQKMDPDRNLQDVDWFMGVYMCVYMGLPKL